MPDIPIFDKVEDANAYIASNLKPAEPEQPPAPAIDEAKVTELVNARLAEQGNQTIAEQEKRNINVFLGDEDNVNAIKKTFTGDDADKKYEAWNKEVQEGKASFKELELLHARGSKVLAAEKAEADKQAKAIASGVGIPGVVGGQPEQLTDLEAAQKMQKIINDPNRSIRNSQVSDEQRKQDDLELKHLSQFLPNTQETNFAQSRWKAAQYHRDTHINIGNAYRPEPAPETKQH